MIIWVLALVLFACLGVAGYCFGVIRALGALVGILLGLLLAGLFGHSLDKPLTSMGVQNNVLLWALGPFIIFLLTLMVVKIIGFTLQRKVNHRFKYYGDLRLGLWDRLNPRLGLCVGFINAAVYLVLISTVIYVLSYGASQVTPATNAAWHVKLLNAAGRSLQTSGMAKIAAAIDPTPAIYYEVSDLAGLIYHNPLAEARLARYPAFLGLGETPEFQAIATDTEFRELRQKGPRISEVWNHPKIQAVVTNKTLLAQVWDLLSPNLKDVEHFLRTGKSETFREVILGRWDFNLNFTLAGLKQQKPNMTSAEMRREKATMETLLTPTRLIATPEKKAFLKKFGRYVPGPPGPNQPQVMTPPPRAGGPGGRGPRGAPPRGGQPPVAAPPATVVAEHRDLEGEWSQDGTVYRFRLRGGVAYDGTVDGDKMTLQRMTPESGPPVLVFERSY